MRYTQITLTKLHGRENWTLIYVRPLPVKTIVRIIKDGENTLNFEDMTIFFAHEQIVDVFLSENHPLFNIRVLHKRLESTPQYKLVEEQISKQFDILIESHTKK